jgi:hypothetical protein
VAHALLALVHMTRPSALFWLLAVVGSAQLATPSSGAASPEQKSELDPKAMKLLAQTASYLRTLPSFVVRADVTQDEVLSADYKVQRTSNVALTVQRPNRLRAQLSGDTGNRLFVYDGKFLNVFMADENYYGSVAAPATLYETLDVFQRNGIELPLLDLMYVSMGGKLEPTIREAGVIGQTTIQGVKCTQVAFRGDVVDWQLWITEGDTPLPRKLVITTNDHAARPQYSALLRWDVATPIAATDFVFTPPATASRFTFAGVLPGTGERKADMNPNGR